MDLGGAALLVMVCFLWGGNSVAIKLSNPGLAPLTAAALRSLVAAAAVWLYARWRGQAAALPAGRWRQGAILGLLFGLDFLFLYWGLAFTNASRAVIFLYTHPFWVALGAHFFIRGDRLTPAKGAGLLLAFAGVLAVFAGGSASLPPEYWIGDIMEMAAALFWAATTLYIKRVSQRPGGAMSHYQMLMAQLIYSIPLLAAAAALLEWGRPLALGPVVLASLFYQCLVVACFSYLLWFWMINRYRISGLAAFTFLTPLFGVALGAGLLGEAVGTLVWLGLGLVGAGIYLVNR
ncbi:MAG: DMT family transporter [Desulfarculus sp.]|nr:MAG: DMT family transporter [Desulfarculus sp.]